MLSIYIFYRTMQSLFNWFYWGINLGALSAILTTSIEKHHSFWLAYLIPLIVFIGTIFVLCIGRHKYIRGPPTGSLLIRAFHVIRSAFRLRWKLGRQERIKHFLDYAKDELDTKTDQFIDDLKQAIHVCRVFAFYPFYTVCYNQLMGNLVSQAAQMNVGKLKNSFE